MLQSPKKGTNFYPMQQDHSNQKSQTLKRSILYNLDPSANISDYFHQNNASAFLQGGATITGSKGKRITLDDISAQAKLRARVQKGLLDESKVNKSVARDLMNSKPMFTVQEIQGGVAQKSGKQPQFQQGGNLFNQATKLQTPKAGGAQLTQKALFDYKKTLVDQKKGDRMTIEERLNEAANEAALDDTRSIKSEFDYSTKKKFVEMISQQPKDKRLKLPEGGAAKGEED